MSKHDEFNNINIINKDGYFHTYENHFSSNFVVESKPINQESFTSKEAVTDSLEVSEPSIYKNLDFKDKEKNTTQNINKEISKVVTNAEATSSGVLAGSITAGTVVTSVAVSTVVVVSFVSSLSLGVSLLFATPYSLAFDININNPNNSIVYCT